MKLLDLLGEKAVLIRDKTHLVLRLDKLGMFQLNELQDEDFSSKMTSISLFLQQSRLEPAQLHRRAHRTWGTLHIQSPSHLIGTGIIKSSHKASRNDSARYLVGAYGLTHH
jgi:hypothetical protein